MKKFTLSVFLTVLLCLTASAQKIAKPTLTPKEATPAQKILINQGIALHDAKRYDEAIAKYQEVLTENPDSTLAIYEMALSLYTKGDTVKSMETAHRGAKYRSEELALFYGLMANAIDDVGKPNEAIKIYLDAIKMLDGDASFNHHTSSLYYNLGITYFRQKKYTESRAACKKAVEYNFNYASPHFLLGVIYDGTKYKIPAILAATRSVSLEVSTDRAQQSAAIINKALKAPTKDAAGSINIFMDMDAPKDEGDFGMYDLMLGTLMIADKKEDKGKSENDLFAEAISTMIDLLSGDKKLKNTFVGKNYVPFLTDMKKLGHTKTFAYLVRYQGGNADALKWLTENEKQLTAFVDWSKSYQLPK